jgi:hypothetical protein
MAPILHQLFENEDEKTLPTITTKTPVKPGFASSNTNVIEKVTRFYYQFPLASKSQSRLLRCVSVAGIALIILTVIILLSISTRNAEYCKALQQQQQGRLDSNSEEFGTTPTECFTANCLAGAAYILSNMDEKQNACESFYNFTCGMYARNYRYSSSEYFSTRSPLELLETANYNQLTEILHGTATSLRRTHKDSSETKSAIEKAAIFYGTCLSGNRVSTFRTASDAVFDLLTYIKSEFNGWMPLLNYKNEPGKQFTKENFVGIMAKMGQINIWNVFNVELKPSANVLNASQLVNYKNPYVLQISCSRCRTDPASVNNLIFDGIQLTGGDTTKKIRNVFYALIRNLQEDAEIDRNETESINQAVADIMHVEHEIETVIKGPALQALAIDSELHTLQWLNNAVPTFNWLEYATSIFGPNVPITADTLILSPHTFLKKLWIYCYSG